MSLAIDTSILIPLEKGDKTITQRMVDLRKTYPSPPSITFINYFEFLCGIQERNPKNKSEALSFIELFSLLNTTKNTAIILSGLKAKYDKIGKSFSLSDLLIASQAIENNMTLVTKDKQFEEITELQKIML